MRNNTEYHVIKISYIGGHKVNLHKEHREKEKKKDNLGWLNTD